jgi:hypothetical protein
VRWEEAVHDALVKRLVLRRETTDEAVRMLVRRSPAVASVEMKSVPGDTLALTDQGVHAMSSLRALTCIDLSRCKLMTDQALRAVSSVSTLKSLNLFCCRGVTDVGVRARSSLPALASLDLSGCYNVTAAGVQALRSTTAAPSLHIKSRHG